MYFACWKDVSCMIKRKTASDCIVQRGLQQNLLSYMFLYNMILWFSKHKVSSSPQHLVWLGPENAVSNRVQQKWCFTLKDMLLPGPLGILIWRHSFRTQTPYVERLKPNGNVILVDTSFAKPNWVNSQHRQPAMQVCPLGHSSPVESLHV